jgi:hypothetical protein
LPQVSEPTELRFSVYNAHTKTFISEEYPVMLTVHGMPAEIGRINNLKTVFTVPLHSVSSLPDDVVGYSSLLYP